jgi:hypothetical protein
VTIEDMEMQVAKAESMLADVALELRNMKARISDDAIAESETLLSSVREHQLQERTAPALVDHTAVRRDRDELANTLARVTGVED